MSRKGEESTNTPHNVADIIGAKTISPKYPGQHQAQPRPVIQPQQVRFCKVNQAVESQVNKPGEDRAQYRTGNPSARNYEKREQNCRCAKTQHAAGDSKAENIGGIVSALRPA